MRITYVLCYISVLLLAFTLQGAEAGGRLSREDIIENHTRRKKQIAKMAEDAEAALADHASGVRKLEEEEHAKTTKRLELYKRKLESMTDELDERDIERMIKREKMRAERYASRDL